MGSIQNRLQTELPKENTSLCKSIITEEPFTWTRRKMFSKETSITLHWRINLIRLFFQKLCKSKTSADLAEQNILIWLIRIPQNMKLLGLKIQLQIKNSTKELQVELKTYLRNQQERKIEIEVTETDFMLLVLVV